MSLGMGHLLSFLLVLLACSTCHGQVVNAICGSCCSQGSYCGVTSVPAGRRRLAQSTQVVQPGTQVVQPGSQVVQPTIQAAQTRSSTAQPSQQVVQDPALPPVAVGTNLVCYLRDRNQPNAKDGGLCVPVGVSNISTFCASYTQDATNIVVPTIYQPGLGQQTDTCKPCCDSNYPDKTGDFSCGPGMQCSSLVVAAGAKPKGVCVPTSLPFSASYCSGLTLTQDVLRCESCDSMTASAQQLVSSLPQNTASNQPQGPTSG